MADKSNPLNLSKINFDAMRKFFAKGHKRAEIERICSVSRQGTGGDAGACLQSTDVPGIMMQMGLGLPAIAIELKAVPSRVHKATQLRSQVPPITAH